MSVLFSLRCILPLADDEALVDDRHFSGGGVVVVGESMGTASSQAKIVGATSRLSWVAAASLRLYLAPSSQPSRCRIYDLPLFDGWLNVSQERPAFEQADSDRMAHQKHALPLTTASNLRERRPVCSPKGETNPPGRPALLRKHTSARSPPPRNSQRKKRWRATADRVGTGDHFSPHLFRPMIHASFDEDQGRSDAMGDWMAAPWNTPTRKRERERERHREDEVQAFVHAQMQESGEQTLLSSWWLQPASVCLSSLS